jgi:ABC transporter with metal-binding/Fe-S-binding domain ATP-binding protein
MRVAVLFSGGKDSAFALFKALKEGHEVVTLVTMKSKSKESFMYHVPNIHLTEHCAIALQLPLIVGTTSGEKEKELEDLKEILKDLKEQEDVEGVVSGAIASQYQKDRVDSICAELGLESIAPLWQQDQFSLIKEMLEKEFKIIVVGVFAGGLTEDWLGRIIDADAIEDLKKLQEKYKISFVGEGGEFESLVLDCPLYKKSLEIEQSKTHWDGSRGELEIKKVKLVKK